MKKRILSVIMTICMLTTLIALGITASADAGEYTAWFGAQMDSESGDVNGWELGDAAMTTFNIGEPATISIEFDELVSFGDGNYIAIETNMPNPFAGELIFTDPGIAQVLSFKLDGQEIERGSAMVNAEGKEALDESGAGLRITLTNKWNNSILAQPLDPAELGEFTNLEVTFIVHGTERTEYNAKFGAQMDSESGEVDGWDLGDVAATKLSIGQPAVIAIDFAETVSFGDGNYIAIETDIPNTYTDVTIFQDPNSAQILSFKLDGEEIEMGDVYINAEGMDAIDGSGAGLRLTITNKWSSDIVEQALDPVDLGEFTSLEIEFIIHGMGMPLKAESDEDEFITSGNAIIGGTFVLEDGEIDWVRFDDQPVAFEVGVPFTVTLDFGDDTQTHAEAEWGYITVVQTDIMANALLYDAFIEKILVDGNEIFFDGSAIELSLDRVEGGLRISLTNGWSDAPVVSGVNSIGTFSKLEVTMVFVEYGTENPFGASEVEEFTPPPSVAPITPPPREETPESGELPGWVIPVIIAAAVVVIISIVLIIVGFRNKGKNEAGGQK